MIAAHRRILLRVLGRHTPTTHGALVIREHTKLRILARQRRALNSTTYYSSSAQETVEAVFVFHRHGDRTPGKSLVADAYAEEEDLFWRTKIPPSDRSYYEMLCDQFPVVVLGPSNDNINNDDDDDDDDQSTLFKDARGGNESYGFLTWKGMHQMYHNGVAMADRYGPRRPIKNLDDDDSQQPIQSFQEYWDIKAFSTNYLRTVKSCQTFLDGLLSSSGSSSKNKDRILNYEQPTYYEGINLEEYRTIIRKNGDTSNNNNNNNSNIVEINVRDSKHETLNAFDSSPELMKKLVGEVFATPDFIENDTKATSLAARLSEYIPGLSKHSSYGGATGINWIHAADYFVCRSSHSVPFAKFSPHLENNKNDPTATAEETFQSTSQATLSHLLSRFRSYYKNPLLLGEMAGPALHEIQLEMNSIVDNYHYNSKNKKKPFRIYSCHDVTILGLLYAIKDRFLSSANHQDNCRLLSSPWPTYATCLTFELVRLATKGKEDKFIIKTWLNEAPIPTFRAVPVAIVTAPHAEPTDTIDLADFNKLIYELNAARASSSNVL